MKALKMNEKSWKNQGVQLQNYPFLSCVLSQGTKFDIKSAKTQYYCLMFGFERESNLNIQES